MTKKEETVRAFEELSFKYRHPLEEEFYNEDSCPLCKIHNKDGEGCIGCPLADKDGNMGCGDFASFKSARMSVTSINKGVLNTIFPSKKSHPNISDSFIARAQFFEKYLEVIKTIDAERFTNKGWKYFEEIDRND